MIHEVIVLPPAEKAFESTYARIAAEAPETAVDWYNGWIEAIGSLSQFPLRYSLAPESVHFSTPVRHLVMGNYRAIYTVKKRRVYLLDFRHVAQRPLGSSS